MSIIQIRKNKRDNDKKINEKYRKPNQDTLNLKLKFDEYNCRYDLKLPKWCKSA